MRLDSIRVLASHTSHAIDRGECPPSPTNNAKAPCPFVDRGAQSDVDRLLIEGWRCSTIYWRKPDSTSIEKRGVWSCGEKKVMVRLCHVTNVTCCLIWPYSIVFSSFFFVRPSFVPESSPRYPASSLKLDRSNRPFSNAAAKLTCLPSLPQMAFFPSNFLSISL